MFRLTTLILFSPYVNSMLKKFYQFQRISLLQAMKKPDSNI